MLKLCKLFLTSLVFLFSLTTMCFANTIDTPQLDSEQIAAKKISVVVFTSRSIRNDIKTMNTLTAKRKHGDRGNVLIIQLLT
ncbi:hypothetical protein SOV_02670 [Sporomusa ovata DSM 2662]|uniref:Uncharacterized protein n=1 Tax=Sporomusa ovata TaxID=2378 RepID=A0A0U1L156_9FIRM|nr:hypothetical protein SOV_2c08590 [Sporomusa ovata DSM 2662]CQR72883.1 hypothetical protein SpAn4DRAFT_3343 [Sporomusa ovata]